MTTTPVLITMDKNLLAEIDTFVSQIRCPPSRSAFICQTLKEYLNSQKPEKRINYFKVIEDKLEKKFRT